MGDYDCYRNTNLSISCFFRFFSCIGALNSKYCSKKMYTYVISPNELKFFQVTSKLAPLSQSALLGVTVVKLEPTDFNVMDPCTEIATYLWYSGLIRLESLFRISVGTPIIL